MLHVHIYASSEEAAARMLGHVHVHVHVGHMGALVPGGEEELPREALAVEAPPPDRPPPCATGGAPPGRRARRHTSPEEAAAMLEEKWARDAERKRLKRAQKKEEQGCSPAPLNRRLPSRDSNSGSGDYSTPAATSSPTALTAPGDSLECVRGHTSNVRGQVADVRGQSTDGGTKGGKASSSFSSVVASFPPKALLQEELPGMSADTASMDRPDASADVPPRTAPRALAAHSVNDGGSAMTQEFELRPGFDIRDAMDELYLQHKGEAYDWTAQDWTTVKRRVAKHGVPTVLRRWANAMTHQFPPCDDVWGFDARWNRHAKPYVPPATQQPAKPQAQTDVGKGDPILHPCPVHGCDVVSKGAAWGLHLCGHHADAMVRDMGGVLSRDAAAAWLAKNNGGAGP